ncbi:unnamed protein product [Cochlearia groenlandica]
MSKVFVMDADGTRFMGIARALRKLGIKANSILGARKMKLGFRTSSWAAWKLETIGVGLPTSPSSTDVRSRLLQAAAAKHDSQPSDETSEYLPYASC